MFLNQYMCVLMRLPVEKLKLSYMGLRNTHTSLHIPAVLSDSWLITVNSICHTIIIINMGMTEQIL